MMYVEKDPVKVGEYLYSLIHQNYKSIRQFCRKYLELKDGETNDEEIRKLLNRFSQIIKGVKKIQIEDLPYVAELLQVSFESILSAGKEHMPVSTHMTNYDIAFSKDREVWDRYMKRGDKLFLNCDEYCKTVIDYAIEFKNYGFIKYLIDNEFIWLVDLSKWNQYGFTFGADTSVKRRKIEYIDTAVPEELHAQDRLRTSTLCLAIENKDYAMLDALLARQVPSIRNANYIGLSRIDFQKERNEDMIAAVANADKQVIDYFSTEFSVKGLWEKSHTFLFPYISTVIKLLVKKGRNDMAELCIRRSIKHNEETYKELEKLIQTACDFYRNPYVKENKAREIALERFSFDSDSNIVYFAHYPSKNESIGLVTNVIRVDCRSNDPLINELIDELNSWFDKTVALKGE